MSIVRPALLALALSPALLAAPYMPSAWVRIHVGGSPTEAAAGVIEAGGDVTAHGRGWIEALVPQDKALNGEAFLGIGTENRAEILMENADHMLDRFRGRPDAGRYHTVAEVATELAALAAAQPAIARVESIGKSHEGRDILALRVGPAAEGRPTFVVCGLHHAREWIAVEVPMGLAHRLVEGYASDPAIKTLVDAREIWIVPVLNPDGLEYSQTQYSMWRKNRRVNADGSIGVDLNRNWGYQWGGAGASDNPDSDTYRGLEAFSEPETRALRDLALREGVTASLSFHSYSELVFWPWSYGYDKAPDDEILAQHARQMAARNGYTAEQSVELYPSSGDFDDWFYGEHGAASFTFELGTEFVPDEDQVDGIVAKNLDAVGYFLEALVDPFPLATHEALGDTTDTAGPYPVALRLAKRFQAADPVVLATLQYRAAGAAEWTTAPLVKKEGGIYAGEIPGAGLGRIEYRAELTDKAGKLHAFPRDGAWSFQVVDRLWLLVDDDQGKSFEAPYQAALAALGLPCRVIESKTLTEAGLLAATGVIWLTGEDSSSTLDAREQGLLTTYLAQGGELALFGQDIGYDLKSSAFLKDRLAARFVNDTAQGHALAGTAGGPLAGWQGTLGGDDALTQRYPDVLEPLAGGHLLLSYGPTPEGAAIGSEGSGKVAYFGFGLEGVAGAAARQTLLGRVTAWLSGGSAETRRLRRATRLAELLAEPGVAAPGPLRQAFRQDAFRE